MVRNPAALAAITALLLGVLVLAGCGSESGADPTAITPPASAQREFAQSEIATAAGQVGITESVVASRVVFESDVAQIDGLAATDFGTLQMTMDGLNFVDPSDAASKTMLTSLGSNGDQPIAVRILLDGELLGEGWVYYPGDASTGAPGIRYSGSDAPQVYNRLKQL